MLKKKHDIFYVIWILYGILSFFTLTIFPRVHSDEAWLSGLSYEILQRKELFITEPFFDLFPRQMHSFKILYHLLLTIGISFFGNTVFSARLLSFVFIMFSILLLHRLFQKRYKDSNLSLFFTFALALNLQVIYASHFGRQEALIFFVLIFSHFLFEEKKSPYLISLVIGLGMAIHPNAFIIAAMIGILYLFPLQVKNLLRYGLSLLFILGIYLSLNLFLNPNFFSDYWQYGQSLAVDAAPFYRFQNLIHYFQKLWLQQGGTYEFVDLRFYFILALILFPIYLFLCTRKKQVPQAFLMTFAFILSIFIIGRYNTTSILFILYPLYLLFFDSLISFFQRPQEKFSSFLLYAFLLFSLYQIYTTIPFEDDKAYKHYENEISPYLIKDKGILGNLSSGFLLADYSFYDIRNLAFLDSNPSSLSASLNNYLTERHIETIIFYEEYDYIHRNPEWNILYGDDSNYYEALKKILENDFLLVHEFESPIYGTRIIRYRDGYPWKIQIYQKRTVPQIDQ